ncbi:MAG: ABC transporter substrate-binding protein [Aureispira sp.]
MRYLSLFLFLWMASQGAAQSTESSGFTINVHETSDPYSLNPVTSTAANAENIEDNIFCRLLDYNRMNFQLEPALAAEMPEVKVPTKGPYKGGMALTYEIHPSATWDNGTPVTGYDYLFTVKAAKHQGVESPRQSSLSFIKEIKVDESNPRKFTIYSKSLSSMSEMITGYNVHLLPEQVYDPKQILRTVKLSDLEGDTKRYSTAVQEFAEDFGADKYSAGIDFIEGCGPYQLVEWITGDKVILERKKAWWGDNVDDNIHLKAYPERIVYHIIPSSNWALSKLEKGELDIVRNVPPRLFYEAQEKAEYKNRVTFHEPSQFAYHYLAFNSKSPKLADKRVRQAIAHAIDRDRIVKELFGGAAMKVNTPVSPHRMHYNLNVKGVEFDLKRAAELLEKAGWKDTDGDDVLDKKIEGQLVKLRLKYNYNRNNTVRKGIGKLLKESLAKIGVRMDLYPIEFPVLLQNARNREYEIIALAWVNSPGSDDLKNVWHTSADTKSGGNRVGFGNAKTDKLIDQILVSLDENERKSLYLEFQERVAAEYPYAFLVVPNQLVMIREGLKYPALGPVRPGYVTRLFKQN